MMRKFERPISSRTRRKRRTLQRESLGVSGVAVARGPAESEHRILFLGLERLAAEQAGVFVGLEVGKPHNHRLGIECRGDRADTLRQPLDEEIGRTLDSL